jgi:hypothetical protein
MVKPTREYGTASGVGQISIIRYYLAILKIFIVPIYRDS